MTFFGFFHLLTVWSRGAYGPNLGYFKNALFGTFRLFLLVQASTSPKKKFIAGLLMPASFRFWCQP